MKAIFSITVPVLALLIISNAFAQEKKPPIAVEIDVSEVPEMKEWTEKAAKVVQEFYPRIVEELGEEGYTKPEKVNLYVKNETKGVAFASGNKITLISQWFKNQPQDVGAVVHEMCHVVQAYRSRTNRPPGWVVEGVADYVRWFVYEPENKRPRVRNPDRAKHTDSYQTTAAFFNWIVKTKDKTFVKRLNLACRGGKYSDDLFKEYAGKSAEELWAEFVEELKKSK
ncbi:MAG: basic secretory protein-like protein [Phycisphaeraceae bacterium]